MNRVAECLGVGCAANVLLAASPSWPNAFRAKVGDFGLSRSMVDQSRVETSTYGTTTHQPPEMLANGTISKVRVWDRHTLSCAQRVPAPVRLAGHGHRPLHALRKPPAPTGTPAGPAQRSCSTGRRGEMSKPFQACCVAVLMTSPY